MYPDWSIVWLYLVSNDENVSLDFWTIYLDDFAFATWDIARKSHVTRLSFTVSRLVVSGRWIEIPNCAWFP